MWKNFNIGAYICGKLAFTNNFMALETAEVADNDEPLALDDEQYPLLPENVIGLRLHCRKAILRLFMVAAQSM